MPPVVSRGVQQAFGHHRRCDNWTLRLDKFSFPDDTRGSWKKAALEVVVREFKVAIPDLGWIDQLKICHGARFRELRLVNRSRLAVALGRASVLENVGLAANPITGLPVIPGSALKGLVATWACWRGNAINADQPDQPAQFRPQFAAKRGDLLDHTRDLALRILGSDDSESADAGDIIFLGGFPIADGTLKLEMEVLTPHTTGQPVPSFFLTVAPGATWRFILMAARRAGDEGVRLLEAAAGWLREALTQVGIGAKTAAGYGRFADPSEIRSLSGSVSQVPAGQSAAVSPVDLHSDYPNEATFRNRVINKLNPGQLENLKSEIPLLQKAANQEWRERLKRLLATREYRDIRKSLKSKGWFPQDWLPNQ